MPLDVQCPKCSRKFRAPEEYAGKRVKCPKCQTPIGIPAAERPPAAPAAPQTPAPKAEETAVPAAGQWFLQTKDGDQYGPVSKKEIDDWIVEGRVDSTCQLLREGEEHWKWAEEVYPELAEAEPAEPGSIEAAPAESEIPDFTAAKPEAPAIGPVGAVLPEVAVAPGTPSASGQPRRRAYPALVTMAKIYSVLAWVAGIIGLLGAIAWAVVSLGAAALTGEGLAGIFSFLFGEVGILLYTFLAVVTLKGTAELITLAMNVEHDVHISADASGKMVDLLSKDR